MRCPSRRPRLFVRSAREAIADSSAQRCEDSIIRGRAGGSVGFAYDNANRRTTLTLPNGVTVAYSYDSDSRVAGMTYSAGGNQLGNLTYSYDADGRVVAKGGSMASTGLPAAVSGNTFNAANAMTAFNGATLSYDANGNLTSDGTNSYGWDARNHLIAIGGANLATFVYDAFGRRADKAINGTTTQFLYDGLNPVQELDGSSPPNVTANLLTGLSIDEYFSRTDTAGTATLLADSLGSTLALTDGSGTVQTQYTYDPFGNVAVSGQQNTNPYQFTGRETDGTGLYFYRARYYSPGPQRFLSQDPAETLSSGSGLYTYASNDPADLVDPLGLYTCFYSISSHTLVCIPNDPNDPFFESNNFASGAPGSCRNNPKCANLHNEGPITPHDYEIGPDVGKNGKMVRHLTPIGGLSNGRGGFELHLWGKNEGCIMTHLNTGDVLNNDLGLEEGDNCLQVNP